MEKILQGQILNWLRTNGVYCLKTRPGAGIPVGCPDIIGLFENKWLAIEVKAEEKSPNQPLQVQTQHRLKEGNAWVYRVYPENWELVKEELRNSFF